MDSSLWIAKSILKRKPCQPVSAAAGFIETERKKPLLGRQGRGVP
jgi:hypothetical protein